MPATTEVISIRLPAELSRRLQAVLGVGEDRSAVLRRLVEVEVELREREARRAVAVAGVETMIAPGPRPPDFSRA